jgi:hypothetical protein
LPLDKGTIEGEESVLMKSHAVVLTLILASVSLVAQETKGSQTPPAAKEAVKDSGQTICTDDYLATLDIPSISAVNPSERVVRFWEGPLWYWADVATPSAYINRQRDAAVKDMNEYYGPSSLDKLEVLRVWVHSPERTDVNGTVEVKVHNVVLRSADHSTVIHSLCHIPIPVSYGNSGVTGNGMFAMFSLKDLKDLLKKGNIVVTYIVADGYQTDCKLDKKRLAMLGLNGQ